MERRWMNVVYLMLCGTLACIALSCRDAVDAVKEEESFSSDEPEMMIQDCSNTPVSHRGIATYYTWADGGGNCGFDPTPNDLMVGAMNPIDYAGSAACGATVAITGPRGRVNVRIVDQCGGCQQGHIDLSPQAFQRIADTSLGLVPIKWRYIASAVQGNIIYHFKDGSNQWWTAIQIRNHRYPIARLEYQTQPGVYKTIRRRDYNYFVEPTGMGPGPYTLRVTDVYGHTLVDSGIPNVSNTNVSGAGQFPLCPTVEQEEHQEQ